MSITSQVSVESFVVGSLGQALSIPFEFLNAGDLLVIRTSATTLQDLTLTLNSDYLVSGAGNPAGGTVTLENTGANYAVGDTITVQRLVAETQPSSYQGDVDMSGLEQALDWIVMQVQQLGEGLKRALRLPVTSSPNAALPMGLTARENSLVGFDGNGNLALVPQNGVFGMKVFQGLTAYTGASAPEPSPTHIDGIEVDSYPVPTLFGCVITVGGISSVKWYNLITSSASPDGYSIIQPVQDSTKRLIALG